MSTRLSIPELSILRFRHLPVDVGVCRVCGADLEVASIGGGRGTKYVCSSKEASTIGQPGGIWGEAARIASEHNSQSEVRVSYHGSADVVAVIDELLERRAADGDDTTIPVGYAHLVDDNDQYPLVHVGDGEWQHRHRCLVHGVRPEGEYRCADCDLNKTTGVI